MIGSELAPRDKGSLTVRGEGTSLAGAQESVVLRRVGITPLMIERLGELNAVLVKNMNTDAGISEAEITLVPGKTPVIETSLRASSNTPKIILTSKISEMVGETPYRMHAKLEFIPGPPHGLFRLQDIQGFVSKLFPDKRVVLSGTPRVGLTEPPPKLGQELGSITQEDFERICAFTEAEVMESLNGPYSRRMVLLYREFYIQVEGVEGFELIFESRQGGNSPETAVNVCNISSLRFEGAPSQVEEAMAVLVWLLKRPFYLLRIETEDTTESE